MASIKGSLASHPICPDGVFVVTVPALLVTLELVAAEGLALLGVVIFTRPIASLEKTGFVISSLKPPLSGADLGFVAAAGMTFCF